MYLRLRKLIYDTLHIFGTFAKLYRVVCKSCNRACGDDDNRAKRVATAKAFFVAEAVATCAAKRAGWRSANVCKQAYAVVVNRQQNACKPIAGQSTACCENCHGMANIPEHTLNKMLNMVYHGIPPYT